MEISYEDRIKNYEQKVSESKPAKIRDPLLELKQESLEHAEKKGEGFDSVAQRKAFFGNLESKGNMAHMDRKYGPASNMEEHKKRQEYAKLSKTKKTSMFHSLYTSHAIEKDEDGVEYDDDEKDSDEEKDKKKKREESKEEEKD